MFVNSFSSHIIFEDVTFEICVGFKLQPTSNSIEPDKESQNKSRSSKPFLEKGVVRCCERDFDQLIHRKPERDLSQFSI